MSSPTKTSPTESVTEQSPTGEVASSVIDEKHPSELSAIRDLAANLRFWTVVVLGLVLDLWSKEWAFNTLRWGDRRVLIPHVLEFQTMMNDGALFGIGSGQIMLFLIASALALLLVAWMFAHSSARGWILQIALGAILAGALGNMYDRMFVRLVKLPGPQAVRYYVKSQSPDGQKIILREYPSRPGDEPIELSLSSAADLPKETGFVRDFIKIPTRIFGDRELWPWVFNVADMLLVGGVGILAIRLWCESRSQPRQGGGQVDAAAKKA